MIQVPQLDPATLFFTVSMLGLLMTGIAFSARRAAPSHAPALLDWSKAMLAAACGFLLLFFRGNAPWLLTFVLANIFVVLVPAFGLLAHAKLFNRRVPLAVALGLAAVGATGALGVQLMGLTLNVGIALLSGAGCVLLSLTAALLAQEALRRKLPAAAFGAAVAGLTALVYGVRAFMGLAGDPRTMVPLSSSNAQVEPALVSALFVVGSSMGFFAMVHSRQRDELLERSRRDGLTGVYTRGAFLDEVAAHEQLPSSQPLAVVMVDVDHFKTINDSFGHSGGDVTLAHVARHIVSAVRITDVVGRYGGEEFCVMLPACDTANAARLADRIVEEARGQSVRLPDGRTVRYTVSAGYAVRSPQAVGKPPESFVELMDRADQALYRAKRTGRNQALA